MARKKHRGKKPSIPPPLPTSTTDPRYQEWVDYVCTQGGGFVAPTGEVQETNPIPTIKARAIPQVQDGTQLLYLENVEGVGIGAATREALEERREGVLLGKAHEREAIRAALGPVIDRLGTTAAPAVSTSNADAIQQEGPPPQTPASTARTKALDIVIYENSRKARRKNTEVAFAGNEKSWLVLMALLCRHPSYYPAQDLGHDVWNLTTRDCDPDPNVVHRTVSDLRKRIAPLGIVPKHTKGIGYRLEEDTSTAPSVKKPKRKLSR